MSGPQRRRRAHPPVAGLAAALVAAGLGLVGPAVVPARSLTSGDITTIAGGTGEGMATTVAQSPRDVLALADGSWLVADNTNHVVRRVDAGAGTESVVAGNGLGGYAGDGGPAVTARLSGPSALALAPDGTLYIADTLNSRVRKVAADEPHTITTVAGNGTTGYLGDLGQATSAELSQPEGVAVHGDNLFIADTGNHRVRKVVLSTGVITTYAGLPLGAGGGPAAGDGLRADLAQLSYPRGLVTDGDGNLFIADSGHSSIRRVDAATGVISTVAAGSLNNPSGVALAGGALLIADTGKNRVQRVDLASGSVTTVAGAQYTGKPNYDGDGGPATAARLFLPMAVAGTPSGDVLIADTLNNRVRAVGGDGTITTVAGNGSPTFSGDGGPARSAQLRYPAGVAADGEGNVYLSDTSHNRVRRVAGLGQVISTVAGDGRNAFDGEDVPGTLASLSSPAGLALFGGSLFIADTFNNRVRRLDLSTGTISTYAGDGSKSAGDGGLGDGNAATAGHLNVPNDVAVDRSGNVFIADTGNHRIRRVDAVTGDITTVAGSDLPGGSATVTRLVGRYSGDGGPATGAGLNGPKGVAVDAAGNVFIADTGNHRIRRVDAATGVITTYAGNGLSVQPGDGGPATSGQLDGPTDVVVAPSGELFIADAFFNRVRKVATNASHTITTVAGTGTGDYSGDGGPATAAALNFPVAVALTADGALLVADNGTRRVRSVKSVVGVPPAITALDPGARHAAIGSAFASMVAVVHDRSGDPVAGAQVTFTAPASGASGTFPGGAASVSVATGDDGAATAPAFTANLRAGAYQVTASTPGITPDAAFNLVNDPGPPAQVQAVAGTPQTAKVDTEFPTALAATVTDVGDNPVPGVAVTFTAPDHEPTATFTTQSGGSAYAISVTTGDDGKATATTLVAGRQAGTYEVVATAEGLAGGATFELTNAPGEGGVISAVAGTPQSARTGEAFATALEVSVRDAADDPVVGAEVTFTAPAEGPSGTFEGGAAAVTVTTGALGRAEAPTFTANDQSGSYTVSATTPGIDTPASFSLTNTVAGAASIAAAGGTPQRAETTKPFALPLQALVRDTDGNRMAGVEVGFRVPDHGPSATFPDGGRAAVAVTDERGIATAPVLTANGEEGSFLAVAGVAGVEGTASFTLTNTAAPATAGPDPAPPCPAAAPGPGRVVYPAGFSLIGLPGGTLLPAGAQLWGWTDQGKGGTYSASPSSGPTAAGAGYWRYFSCPTAVDLAPGGGPVEVHLGAYHASLVGNPTGGPVRVSGQDYAARYDATLGGGRGGYRLSGYRQPQDLAPGEGIWVFAYADTTVRIGP